MPETAQNFEHRTAGKTISTRPRLIGIFIDTKLDEYKQALENEDDGKKAEEIKETIERHKKKKRDYRKLEQQLKDSGEAQVSISDPDSRLMMPRNNYTEVAYNIQTTVDSKNCIPIDYLVTNEIDSKAMGKMLERTKEILGTNEFVSLMIKDTTMEVNLKKRMI